MDWNACPGIWWACNSCRCKQASGRGPQVGLTAPRSLLFARDSKPLASMVLLVAQAEKRLQVSWECQNQMFRNEKETGDDIRLSTRLFNKCLVDQQKFCPDVEPGHMRVQECLEDNIDESGFSAECKTELENVIAKRVSDFRLDTALREACEDDLKETCGTSLKDMDEVRAAAEGRLAGRLAVAELEAVGFMPVSGGLQPHSF